MNPSSNLLTEESSPYLLQHAHNPVDWMPWGSAAFDKARRENKPVFLSIGYAACHWCHVMERESFEDESIAALLNERFVSVKVDREERPDVDHHYMNIVQALTGGGGWPLSVFLTSERKAFYGGTYWPPSARYGRPGFRDVLISISAAWSERRTDIEAALKEIDEHIIARAGRSAMTTIPAGLVEETLQLAKERFDNINGGFGSAPKFPNALELSLLLSLAEEHPDAAVMALKTLKQMALGGIYDQLGGGFHRYSTDAEWRVPHFEKMLYDNALLIPAYFDAAHLTNAKIFAETARGCLNWAIREMEMPDGGFASSLDADSEGEEGRFYVWRADEIDATLGIECGSALRQVFHVTPEGNFENETSILFTSDASSAALESAQFVEAKSKLLHVRAGRIRPARDDKVLTDWNGLMLSALVRGAAFFPDEHYLPHAQKYADRILNQFASSGKLAHSLPIAKTQSTQFLLDYAALANGLIDLYLADGNGRWLNASIKLVNQMDELFAQANDCYFMSDDFFSSRPVVDIYDHATPSGVSMACIALLKLYSLSGGGRYREQMEQQLLFLASSMMRVPTAMPAAITATHALASPPATVVIVGDPQRTLWASVARNNPLRCLAIWYDRKSADKLPPELKEFFAGKESLDGLPTAYVCRNFVCELPVHTAEEVAIILDHYSSLQAL